MSHLSNVEIEDAQIVFNELRSKGVFPEKSRWLITGAGGFLGSQILNVLSEARKEGFDCDTTVMESNVRGDARNWYFENIKVLQHDVIEPWPEIGDFTHVVHLASIASPVHYRKFPLLTLQSNYMGTLHALELAKRCDSRILLMSSSEIYGDPVPEQIPTPESYRGNVSSTGPRACYDEGKRVMETLAWIYAIENHMNISVARPFNFYGPGMRLDDGRILPDIFNAVANDSDIILYSDGSPTRSFCYARDAVNALFQMVLSEKTWKLYNIGNPQAEISMRELAEKASHIAISMGWNGIIKYKKSLESDFLVNNPIRRLPETKLIESELKWKACVDLETGLRRSLMHFQEIKS